MFSFAYPQYLYLLLLLPAVAGLFLLARKARARDLNTFGRRDQVDRLMPDASPYKPWVKLVLELLLLLLVVVILARPRAGVGKETAKIRGIEAIIAVDVSNSMNASTTDSPQDISRLQRAKLIVQKMLETFDNDRVGLIVFAGNAYMRMPLTNDLGSAKLFLSDLSTNMVSTQGTAIGSAITLAAQSFSQSKKSQKTIIVVTDGENFEDDAKGAAHQANKKGIQVNVIGVGGTHGAPIPTADGYLTDDQGNPVTTFLNEQQAQEIAKAGKGVYINGNASDAVEMLRETLDKLAKTELDNVSYTRHDEQFPIFAVLAMLPLIALLILLPRQNRWVDRFNLFNRRQS